MTANPGLYNLSCKKALDNIDQWYTSNVNHQVVRKNGTLNVNYAIHTIHSCLMMKYSVIFV